MASDNTIMIVNVDRIDGTAVLVEFADRTSVTLTGEELAALRPNRSMPIEDMTDEGDAKHQTR